MRTWSRARNAYLVAKGQSDKPLAAAEESRTDAARAGKLHQSQRADPKLSCVIAPQATMTVAGSLRALARMPSSSPSSFIRRVRARRCGP